jgi:predicted DNA-binding transcriptional regulator AlpA
MRTNPLRREATMQAQFALPETGFVRLPQVLSVFPVSRSTWWAGVKVGKYPQPVKLGPNTTAWRAEDIRSLIAKQAVNSLQPA